MIIMWILLSILLATASSSSDTCTIDWRKMNCADKGLFGFPNGKYEKVDILDMESNYIDVIEKDLKTRFPNVYKINLFDNELNKLDLGALLSFDECGASLCTRLELDVSKNYITKVLPPPREKQLQSLVQLYMDYNLIESVPVNAFVGAPNLYKLSVSHSLFKTRLPSDRPFLEHPRLKHLILNGCDASHISSRTFSGLPVLLFLSLNACGIRDLSADVFSNVSTLSVLSLDANFITHIQHGSFPFFPSLGSLSLRENPLQSIDPNVLPLVSKCMLIISGTPLVRACAHKHLVEWAITRSIIIDVNRDEHVLQKCSFYTDIVLRYGINDL